MVILMLYILISVGITYGFISSQDNEFTLVNCIKSVISGWIFAPLLLGVLIHKICIKYGKKSNK